LFIFNIIFMPEGVPTQERRTPELHPFFRQDPDEGHKLGRAEQPSSAEILRIKELARVRKEVEEARAKKKLAEILNTSGTENAVNDALDTALPTRDPELDAFIDEAAKKTTDAIFGKPKTGTN
jgi:hypothetical protein